METFTKLFGSLLVLVYHCSDYRILRKNRSRLTRYYFCIRDGGLGPMVMRVASFFLVQTIYCLNGHSFIEKELKQFGDKAEYGCGSTVARHVRQNAGVSILSQGHQAAETHLAQGLRRPSSHGLPSAVGDRPARVHVGVLGSGVRSGESRRQVQGQIRPRLRDARRRHIDRALTVAQCPRRPDGRRRKPARARIVVQV